jgi:hypothetical protein
VFTDSADAAAAALRVDQPFGAYVLEVAVELRVKVDDRGKPVVLGRPSA